MNRTSSLRMFFAIFCLREIPFGEDGSFSFDAMIDALYQRSHQWIRKPCQSNFENDCAKFRGIVPARKNLASP